MGFGLLYPLDTRQRYHHHPASAALGNMRDPFFIPRLVGSPALVFPNGLGELIAAGVLQDHEMAWDRGDLEGGDQGWGVVGVFAPQALLHRGFSEKSGWRQGVLASNLLLLVGVLGLDWQILCLSPWKLVSLNFFWRGWGFTCLPVGMGVGRTLGKLGNGWVMERRWKKKSVYLGTTYL